MPSAPAPAPAASSAPAASAPPAPAAAPSAAGTAPSATPPVSPAPAVSPTAPVSPTGAVSPTGPVSPTTPAVAPAPAAADASASGSLGTGVDLGAGVSAEPGPPAPVATPPVVAAPVVSEPRPAAIEDVHLDEQPSLTPFTYSGSFFSRYELRDGYADHGLTDPRLNREGDAFVYRARLGIETNPVKLGSGQSVLVKFVPQAAGTHAMGGTPETIGDAYPLGLYEAYIRLKGRGFRLDLGRFMMNYGDGLVIGQNDWHEAGRAFQGGRVRLTSANKPDYYTDLFITLIQEGIAGTKSVFKGDQYFYGMYTSLGELGAKGPILDVYLLGRTFGGLPADDSVTPSLPGQDGATTLTLGSRIAQAFTHFDYRLEAGVQVGQSQQARGVKPLDRVAFQADGAVGV
ncbi:MAG TPA: alginate export family protein, partial [Polyangiaceae bacterium]|nr:alginate export family protein [Polyangiaceae bacterium]